ncbi:MAG: mercuric reductase [Candidatus Nitrohelix vancouverensis]|uniref:Mercuric reductase n=1 Tax=Candidatus Nitrohelix vancouverensis TaxID=2705534 RepID=A0A7T0C217_9BACT|nr:MAG: mercuric reductase [Candidatus Nitrohelix vancouverensis]
MAKFDYNVVVIGGGSAGLVSSYICAAVKAKVALIEKNKMGGDCLNTGCVPSKALIRTSKILSYIRNHERYGIRSASAEFEFSDVMDRVRQVIGRIEPHDSVERYQKLGVDCYQNAAKILSPNEVRVGDRVLTTKNIIVATGAGPAIPNIPGLDQVDFLTTDTIWNLRELPKRLVIAGGGPIGSELTQCFARLGSQVTQVEMMPELLNREDPDVGARIHQQFVSEGVDVRVNTRCKEIKVENGQAVMLVEKDGVEDRIPFDKVLVAVGRSANSKGFGLEELGVRLTARGTIEVDDYLRTTTHTNIYACGDVAGPFQFTHTAAHQAWYCAVNALFSPLKKFKVDYSVIPWCTFTDPEAARVGLNETEAKAQGIPYETTVYPIDDLDRAIADSEDHGWVKVLTTPGKDRILGVTIVGYHAGDLIAEYVAAMKGGYGLNRILSTIHIYPTMAEANKFAAGVWKKAHAPENLLKWVARFHQWRRG